MIKSAERARHRHAHGQHHFQDGLGHEPYIPPSPVAAGRLRVVEVGEADGDKGYVVYATLVAVNIWGDYTSVTDNQLITQRLHIEGHGIMRHLYI